MGCERCNGWMMSEQCAWCNADGKLTHMVRWRCVNCGNVVDAIIVKNRAASAVSAAPAARRDQSHAAGVS